MINKLLLLMVGVVAILLLCCQIAKVLPHLSLPKFQGSQTNSVDVEKLTTAFTSAQGFSAGESIIENIDVTRNERLIKQLPWLAGSCVKLKNGKAKITYHSDTKQMPPTVLQDATGITLKIADPTVRSVGITEFSSKAVHMSQLCALVPTPPDLQSVNRILQATACDWAKNDTSQLEAHRADVKTTILALVSTLGITAPVNIQFQPVKSTLPYECDGLGIKP